METFVDRIAHLVYPRYSNNHKARLIHPDSVFALASLILALQLLLRSFPAVGLRILGYASNISPDKVIELTNRKRSEAGLPDLRYNPSLAIAAKAKAEHMLANDYWAHTAPDGTEPWVFFANVGYKYRYAGENLARDFSDPQSAMDAWMASPSHRDNILSLRYSEIGVAVVEGDLAGADTTIIVQLFGYPASSTQQVPVAKAYSESTPTPVPSRPPQLVAIAATPAEGLSLTPTLVPSPVLTPTPKGGIGATGEELSYSQGVLISPFTATKSISLAVILVIILIMVLDAFVVYKKKIPRISGRTFAHLAFLATILIIALLSKSGVIL